jgi:hypothetical protein
MEDSPETITWFSNTDIAVLRSGKAKKNDPPIPADLAPISGAGKRVKKEKEEEKLFLDPIKFRYSTENLVDEPEEPVAEEVSEAAEPKEGKSRRNRSRRKPQGDQAEKQEKMDKKPEAPKPEKKEPKAPKAPKAEPAEAAEAADEQMKKPHRRRNNYRRGHKPKQGGEG